MKIFDEFQAALDRTMGKILPLAAGAGGVVGAFVGFKNAGIGGAIVGAAVGGFAIFIAVGAVLGFLHFLSEQLSLLLIPILVVAAIVLLWGVGKP